MISGQKESFPTMSTRSTPWELRAVTEWATAFLLVRPCNEWVLLHAGSRAGKASFAESLLQNPFVVAVEDNPSLDSKGFRRADRRTPEPPDKNGARATRGDNTGHQCRYRQKLLDEYHM